MEHLSQHPTLAQGRLRRDGYESLMVVPLQLHNQLVGTLSLFTKSARGFDAYERSFFHQVGVTIENALLYEEAARRERDAAFLDRATQLFNSTLDLDVILQQVPIWLPRFWGQLHDQPDRGTGNAYLRPGGQLSSRPQARRPAYRSNGSIPSGSVMRRAWWGWRQWTAAPTWSKTPGRRARAVCGPLNIHSIIAVPILVKERILGVLATSIAHPGRQFTQADLRLALALADRAAWPSRTRGSTRRSGGCGRSWRT